MKTLLPMKKNKSIFIGFMAAVLVFIVVMYGGKFSMLRGSLSTLLTDTEIAFTLKTLADTDADGVLTPREIRRSLVSIIRGVALGSSENDINHDGVVNRADITDTIRAFRALLQAVCGNGTTEAGEQCDDNNTNSGDGCSNVCAVESGYTCTQTPSVCTENTPPVAGGLGSCGTGLFLPKVDYRSIHEPLASVLADVNGDGRMDLVQVNALQRISTLFGNSDGTFAPAVEGHIGFYSDYLRDFAFGDLNGDGRADIVTANGISIGRGDGTFDEPTNVHNLGRVHFGNTIITDIDNDGDNDVIIGSKFSNNLLVALNDGLANFTQHTTYTSPQLGWIVSIDIDADGDRDILANTGSDGLVFLNNGDGTLAPFQIYRGGVYPSAFAIADFNGDHALDIYSILGDFSSPDARIGIRFSNGDGTFGTYDDGALSVKQSTSLVTADFNGDGMADIARAVEENNTLYISFGSHNRISNRVTQLFDTGGSYTTGIIPRFIGLGDFNGDNALDLVTSNYGSDTVSVFLGLSRENAFCPAGQ